MISVLRNFSGYWEYPKYAVMKKAVKLVQKGIILKKEDISYLFFEEFREAFNTNDLDYSSIRSRKKEYSVFKKLSPPRVMDLRRWNYIRWIRQQQSTWRGIGGHTCFIRYHRRMCADHFKDDRRLPGGGGHFSHHLHLSKLDAVVCIRKRRGHGSRRPYLNTHGAVIAREYGLPAVVGVKNAKKLIKDGQRIRVNGTQRYVRTAVTGKTQFHNWDRLSCMDIKANLLFLKALINNSLKLSWNIRVDNFP